MLRDVGRPDALADGGQGCRLPLAADKDLHVHLSPGFDKPSSSASRLMGPAVRVAMASLMAGVLPRDDVAAMGRVVYMHGAMTVVAVAREVGGGFWDDAAAVQGVKAVVAAEESVQAMRQSGADRVGISVRGAPNIGSALAHIFDQQQ